MADAWLLFERALAWVEVLADRGEWSVALTQDGFNDWFHPDVWEAYLDDFPLAGELSGFDHQVTFLTTRLDEALTAARRSRHLEHELKRADEEYMRRFLGLGPEADD